MSTGAQLKKQGMAQAEANNLEFTTEAKKIALWYCKRFGQVTSDNVRRITDRRGLEPSNYNCMGSVMRGAGLTLKGYTKSRIRSNHRRIIGIWVMP